MEEIKESLKIAGLTGNESRVYTALIKIGKTSANELARNLGIDRTLTYTLLNHLIEKGMVSYVIVSNKKLFSATSPENLLNKLKADEEILKKAITELKNIKAVAEPSSEIKVYEGKGGLRTFLKILVKNGKLAIFGATGRLYDSLFEVEAFAKHIKKSFSARIISNVKYREHRIGRINQISIKYLNIESEATTTIFGDYIAIHVLTNKPIIITIKNKEIAQGYLNYFNALWKLAKD